MKYKEMDKEQLITTLYKRDGDLAATQIRWYADRSRSAFFENKYQRLQKRVAIASAINVVVILSLLLQVLVG